LKPLRCRPSQHLDQLQWTLTRRACTLPKVTSAEGTTLKPGTAVSQVRSLRDSILFRISTRHYPAGLSCVASARLVNSISIVKFSTAIQPDEDQEQFLTVDG
jgi:hypothetical protein